ncbi:MAG: sugar kinase [Candidatus Diapherotrites archaeon]|nr:sugar kinase [Candidatus Diapherotrites archaeon]
MVDLVVAGLVAFDDVSTPHGSVEKAMGGPGCYSSVAASLFCRTGLVGVAGADFPAEYTKVLESKGVDLAGLQVVEDKTFHWKGVYEGDMNAAQTIFTRLNALTQFRAEIPAQYLGVKYLLVTNFDPEIQLELMKQTSAVVAMDTMNYWINNTREKLLEAIAATDILFINDAESLQLTGAQGLEGAGAELLGMGPKQVIIKRGAQGSMLFEGSEVFSCKAYPLEQVVDPTGCGDSFAGGVMGCLAAGKTMREAIVYGSAVASFNAEGFSLDRLREATPESVGERCEAIRRLTSF